MNGKRVFWVLMPFALGATGWLEWDRLALQRKLSKLADSQEKAAAISIEVGERAKVLAESQNAMAVALARAPRSDTALNVAPSPRTPIIEDSPQLDSPESDANAAAKAFARTLDSHFDNQNPRAPWSPQNRVGVESALHKLGAAKRGIQGLECRGDICRTAIPFSGNAEAMSFMQQLPQTQNGGWTGAVAANVVNEPDGTFTVKFYATLPGTNLPSPEQ